MVRFQVYMDLIYQALLMTKKGFEEKISLS